MSQSEYSTGYGYVDAEHFRQRYLLHALKGRMVRV
jgi:hypothetical protein